MIQSTSSGGTQDSVEMAGQESSTVSPRLQMKDHLKRKEGPLQGSMVTLRPAKARVLRPVLGRLLTDIFEAENDSTEPDNISTEPENDSTEPDLLNENISTESKSASSLTVLSYRLIKKEKRDDVEMPSVFDVTDVPIVPEDVAAAQVGDLGLAPAEAPEDAVVGRREDEPAQPPEDAAVDDRDDREDETAQPPEDVAAAQVADLGLAPAQADADPEDAVVGGAVAQEDFVDDDGEGEDAPAVVDQNAVRVAKEKRINNILRILNSKDVRKVQSLQMVGPKTAVKIITHRDEEGPFRSILDLKKMKSLPQPSFFKGFCRENKIEM